MDVTRYLKGQGYGTVDRSFYRLISLWEDWYRSDVRKFHYYKVYNGQTYVRQKRYSLGMAKKISEDLADLLMNEKVGITVSDPRTQAFIDRVFRDNNMLVRLNEYQERKAYTGTVAYIPNISGADVEKGAIVAGTGRIKVDCVSASRIYPLSWENGRISECAFVFMRAVDSRRYAHIQIHALEGGEYVITNHIADAESGRDVPQERWGCLKGFEGLCPRVYPGTSERQFVIDTLNIVNNADEDNPMGIALFANCIDQLKGADVVYDSYVNEFQMGKKRIFVAPEMMLGNSTEDIERFIKDALDASYPEMFELYDRVLENEYVRNRALYEQVNAQYIPYEQNLQLQQAAEALRAQTAGDFENITHSMGFMVDMGGGRRVFTPLSVYYQQYLDEAMVDIAFGAFDYGSVLRRTVTQMVNSGIRTVYFAPKDSKRLYTNRIDVAVRRAVLTGASKLAGEISQYNARQLNTEYFEVSWHENARPTHRVWHGQVWSRSELESVCGLGSVTGLCGANCYHSYYPFVPGISERLYTDEWLAQQAREEDTPRYFKGKGYTAYEATQKQRQMETAMRAQRERVHLLKQGGADDDEVMLARCRYQGQLDEYARFSKKMGLVQQRERIYLDMRGRVAPSQRTHRSRRAAERARPRQERRTDTGGAKTTVVNSLKSGIIRSDGRSQKMDLQLFAEKDMYGQASGSLKRAIRKYEKRLREHESYIREPEKHCPDWHEKSAEEQAGLKRHWEKEIRNFETSIRDRVDELKKRGDYDD